MTSFNYFSTTTGTSSTLLADRAKRVLKMRYEHSIPVEEIAFYLKVSRRYVYHLLGQINDVLLRCMCRTLMPTCVSPAITTAYIQWDQSRGLLRGHG
jgi:hypothetical protein